MKKISLLDNTAFWLTSNKTTERWAHMEKMLKTTGIKASKINGEVIIPYTIGIAKAHLEAVSSAYGPILVLEDDAELLETVYPTEFEVPNDCDALYLGTSTYGMIKGQTAGNSVLAAKYNDNLLRVFNMLGMHAILYLTEEYKMHTIDTLKEFIENPIGGCDDPIAKTMWRWNVYALSSPIFYQADGRSEEVTSRKINYLL